MGPRSIDLKAQIDRGTLKLTAAERGAIYSGRVAHGRGEKRYKCPWIGLLGGLWRLGWDLAEEESK